MLEAIAQVLQQNSGVVYFLIICLILYLARSRFVIVSHWHHTYDNAQFSVQDFYSTVESSFKERKLPDAYTTRTIHYNRVFFSGRREYLRIKGNGMAFDICAATNGRGCYISWWQHENFNNFERLILMKIPVINWIYRTQTLHQYDRELMFQDVVHTCVMEAADAMTGVKGSTLSESERAIIHNWTALK